MVRFFNQKEEVMTLTLTPHGKQKFSKGEFLPKHYAFYDNSVLYDGDYGYKFDETQNSIVTRISKETPRLTPITRFTSSVTQVATINNSPDTFSETNNWNSSFYRYLGQSSPWVEYAPAWNVRALDISDTTFNTGSSYVSQNTIPTLSATLLIEYTSNSIPNSDKKTFNLIKSDRLILDFQEKNTLFKVDGNFDIEVFESSSVGGAVKPLKFINRDSPQRDGLRSQLQPYTLASTIKGTGQQVNGAFPVLDETYVEFYLDIATDTEIVDVVMPTNSTLYKKDVDSNPIDICKISNFGGRD